VAAPRSTEAYPTRFWRPLEDGVVECGICPRLCRLREGQRGFCYVRGNVGGAVVLLTHGRSNGFCIDPIEKKPLNHFLPGTPVLSFGTAGCNLGCKFCQNWDISKSRSADALTAAAPPETIARVARDLGCRSVAFTYNDPVVFHEYCLDTARACREQGLRTVAVSAGYQCRGPREEFYRFMDAANIDLKGFTDGFYQRLCAGRLQPVLETLRYIHHETSTWLEITTLLIPGWNDSEAELEAMTQWIVENLGQEVPVHFSAFHPDWHLRDVPPTPAATLHEARRIALKNGIRHAYLGNVRDREGDSTFCHRCGHLLIGREGYDLTEWRLTRQGACPRCGTPCAGVFEERPGRWGSRRMPVRMP
jgi:pyruvate formate lyase activating enzyme